MEQNNFIEINNVQKCYNDLIVLKEINISIQRGEFIAIVGKSGCGKSTLLRLIAGLEEATTGTIAQNDVILSGINQQARMMFQDGRLLPWKTVIENIGLGLSGDWKPRALDALKNVGLEDRADDYPSTLSGGQKQRIALARALVCKPDLLLLDEPLGALDALTRMEMQCMIEAVWEKNQITSILVTHDVEEAVRLSDRIILLENGRIKLDKRIDLSRPRSRTDNLYNKYVEEILNKIMDTDQ